MTSPIMIRIQTQADCKHTLALRFDFPAAPAAVTQTLIRLQGERSIQRLQWLGETIELGEEGE